MPSIFPHGAWWGVSVAGRPEPLMYSTREAAQRRVLMLLGY